MIRDQWELSQDYKENYTEILSEHLLPLRTMAGITQEELSNLIGISRQSYYAIETGRRAMTWSNFLSLMLFFDTNSATHTMLRDIGAYPTEFMVKISG